MGLKVMFIHSGAGIGGAPVSMVTLAASLDPKLYDPHVVFTDNGPMIDISRQMGLKASVVKMRGVMAYGAHVPLSIKPVINFAIQFIPTIIKARQLIKTEKPDFIHLNTSALISIGIMARIAKVPIIWHIREVVNPGTLFGHLLARAICFLSYRVIAVSDHVAQCLPEGEKISVVHNPVNTSIFDPKYKKKYREKTNSLIGLSKRNLIIGILGSVQKEKGHFVLAEAARIIKKKFPQVVFLIVGGGAPEGYADTLRGRLKTFLRVPLDNQAKLNRVLSKIDLTEEFKSVGYQADVAPYVGSMDILVAPNIKPEGCPRSLLEAMSMSVPVVVSDIGPSREIMGDKCAYFCEPGNVLSLSSQLIALIESKVLRKQLGNAGRVRALSKFEVANHIEKIQNLYGSVSDEINSKSVMRQ
ncbi:MAG: glycosyltransferase family 4 protein [SAR202 cluster bacterium]|nr:glycosyltransferase family 4 protein [SAR202 cluster bacterium]|tara:strand:- start:33834 stop:35075 length:1242 start_codon:yes stop_codon:yes gene_type:complete